MSDAVEDNAYGSDTVLPFRADRSAMVKIQRRFLNLNRERLRRVVEGMHPSQRVVLDVLPLLFHTNHPMMPGYVDKTCPAGIYSYSPGQRAQNAAKRVARSFSYPKRALRSLDIESIFLMGSTGTIAQSTRSDFDIWLCHRAGLEKERLALLQRKCSAISEWAETLGLEVHVFVMQAEEFRAGSAESLSSESSGTTQHHLLLDEFYRTALLLAGRAPLWWMVPPEFESDYASFIKTLIRHRFIKIEEYIDLGSVADIQAAEFYGATLWQLSKAVSAPHKSLLKILLLEAYAADHPDIDLLCIRFKRAVYEGVKNIERLDPYVLMHAKVEEHLSRLDDRDRLELARRSFYFKVNQPLSAAYAASNPDWRRELAAEVVAEWGWDDAHLQVLDERARWKIDRTLKERRSLVKALTRTYKSLSRFARENARESMVSERDVTILGRKLFTMFEHKAGKIDLINQAISQDLAESHLLVQRVRPAQGQPYWLLFRGQRPASKRNAGDAIKRGWSVLELLAWSYFNGLLTPATRVVVAASDRRIDARESVKITEHLHRHFPGDLVQLADLDDYARLPHVIAAGVFVNLGIDPLSAHERKGTRLTTSRSDALSYSGWQENLVQEVDYLLVTSWREVLTFQYRGIDGLLACLCEHLRWSTREGAGGKPLSVSCCAPRHEETIGRRMSSLFETVVDWFSAPGEVDRRRYVLRADRRFHVLLAVGDAPAHDFSGTWQELVAHLSTPNPEFTSVSFDPQALEDPLLAHVYARNAPDVIQFFYYVTGNTVQIMILDEHGALFCDRTQFFSERFLLQQYDQFFESIRLRQDSSIRLPQVDTSLSSGTYIEAMRQLDEDTTSGNSGATVDFSRVTRPRGKDYRIADAGFEPAHARRFYDVEVIGDTVNGEATFTLYCNGSEFSTQEYGTKVFEQVAANILQHRRDAEDYPIYITDVDLSRLPIEGTPDGRLQTIHYLNYKRRIERRLNEAMKRLSAPSAGEPADEPVPEAAK